MHNIYASISELQATAILFHYYIGKDARINLFQLKQSLSRCHKETEVRVIPGAYLSSYIIGADRRYELVGTERQANEVLTAIASIELNIPEEDSGAVIYNSRSFQRNQFGKECNITSIFPKFPKKHSCCL